MKGGNAYEVNISFRSLGIHSMIALLNLMVSGKYEGHYV
jgi:hypothetical protein